MHYIWSKPIFMRKLILQVVLIAMVTLVATPNIYAGIPIQESPAVTQNTVQAQSAEQTAKLTTVQKIVVKKLNKKLNADAAAGGKSQLVALLLCILVGGLGIHRFYLGYIWQGVVQLLTAGGFGIWWLIDLIRIITGSLGPKDGAYSSTL